MRMVQLSVLAVLLTGCSVANAAVDVATLPVKIGSKSVDLATTSQAEADQKRGRELRKQEEAAGRRARQSADHDAADAEARWISQCRQLSALGQPCPPPPPITPPAPDPRAH